MMPDRLPAATRKPLPRAMLGALLAATALCPAACDQAPEEPPAPRSLVEGLELDDEGHVVDPPGTVREEAAEAELPAGDGSEDPPNEGRTERVETDARALQRTVWWQAAEGAAFRTLRFHDSAVTFVTVEGQEILFAADFSATSLRCGGYPLCVLTVGPQQEPVPLFFARQDGFLILVECISAVGRSREEWEALAEQTRAEKGGMITWDQTPSLCWNPASVPFEPRPLWFSDADAERYATQGADMEFEPPAGSPAPPPR